jgi:hypothetical protein
MDDGVYTRARLLYDSPNDASADGTAAKFNAFELVSPVALVDDTCP